MRGKKRPMAERAQAMGIALVNGPAAASDQLGIPESTIRLWMDRPEYAELRTKTREELAEGFKALAHLAMTQLIAQAQAGLIEPRDLTILLGVATDKHLLMSGEAISRTETRTWTDSLDDTEKQRLRDWIDSLDGPAGTGRQGETSADPVGVGAEVRQPSAESVL